MLRRAEPVADMYERNYVYVRLSTSALCFVTIITVVSLKTIE